MSSLQQQVKRIAETSAIVTGAAMWARRRNSSNALILAYHNIVPNGHMPVGDRSLHLPQAEFAAQLHELGRTHDIVPLMDALRPARAQRRPRAAITFDDAYAGAMTAGVYELRKRDIPATVFVTPSLLEGGIFWWDLLADPKSGLQDAVRARVLEEARGITSEALKLFPISAAAYDAIPLFARCASVTQLECALENVDLTLGSHTWSHANLTRLKPGELHDELARPLRWLERYEPRSIPVISYPYGYANEQTWSATATAGYTAGLMIGGGWVSGNSSNPYAIPRLNIPSGLSRSGFELRAAGLIAAK